MNNGDERLAIRIFMEEKGLKFKDFESHFSKSTISKILYAKSNVTDGSLSRFDEILKSGGLIHLLFSLDRLWVIGRKYGVNINPDCFYFPERIPDRVKIIIANEHPLFNRFKNSELK